MSRTVKKYLPKWKLTKYFHHKMIIELGEQLAEPVVIVETKTEEQKLMEKFNDDKWLYDNMLITYEELQRRKTIK